MKPDQVTDAMVKTVCEAVGMYARDGVCQKEIIAAAYNAVVGDDEPITEEWLVKMGYVLIDPDQEIYRKVIGDRAISVDADGAVYLDFGLLRGTKTIGQLRALHAGLGIEVGK